MLCPMRWIALVMLLAFLSAATAAQTSEEDQRLREGLIQDILRQSTRPVSAVCNATQATDDFSRWRSFLGDVSAVVDDGGNEAARLYHLAAVELLESDRGRAIRKECDMLGWISPDDPPLLLDSPETAAVPTTRSHVVHSVRHARAVRSECAADGVECIVRQDHPDPPRAVDFLLTRLRAAGRPETEAR